jgi:Fe-S-cluster containining protein
MEQMGAPRIPTPGWEHDRIEPMEFAKQPAMLQNASAMEAETPQANPLEDPIGFISVPTPRLRTLMSKQKAALTPDEFSQFIATIRSAFEKYAARLAEFSAGLPRARAMHDMMDQAMKSAAHIRVSCCKGCSGCCHYEVEITHDEAVLLATIVRGGVTIDGSRLKEQAMRERKSPKWNDIPRADNRCVFLGPDEACLIYEQRPSACRRLIVTSRPENCSLPGEPVTPVDVTLAEILLSASLSIEGASYASLSKMLLPLLSTEPGEAAAT